MHTGIQIRILEVELTLSYLDRSEKLAFELNNAKAAAVSVSHVSLTDRRCRCLANFFIRLTPILERETERCRGLSQFDTEHGTAS